MPTRLSLHQRAGALFPTSVLPRLCKLPLQPPYLIPAFAHVRQALGGHRGVRVHLQQRPCPHGLLHVAPERYGSLRQVVALCVQLSQCPLAPRLGFLRLVQRLLQGGSALLQRRVTLAQALHLLEEVGVGQTLLLLREQGTGRGQAPGVSGGRR